MKPNGQVELQFNWIFVLIVGVIILGFFITIVVRQKASSEQQMSVDFFVNFEKALSGISATPGKMLIFEIPSMDLRYDCTVDCNCAAYAGTSRAKSIVTPFEFNDKVIFSPNRLKGNNLMVWSEEWSYPFRIVNMLFMTSPEVKYLIEESGTDIYDALPPIFIDDSGTQKKAFDKDFFDGKTISGATGNYKIKLVFIDTNPETFPIPNELKSLPDSDFTAVWINYSNVQTSGTVIFYQKNKNQNKFVKTGQSYLFGEETIYAAIYAEDLNAYACMMNRAFKTLNTVSSVYNAKRDILEKSEITSQDCKLHYKDTTLNSLAQNSKLFDFKLTGQQASTIGSNSRGIQAQNQDALKASCPQIY